eukprot:GGOE01055541.1.p1 GENE.GGOE01055541.1~~GGOE01055541.1.p1  ORF type:complete len:802 (+),score=153.52 GGOE01055541.1:232-2406(+)
MASMLGLAGWVLSRPSTSWWRSGRLATWLWNLDASMPLTQRLPTPVRVSYLAFIAMSVVLGITVEVQRAFLRLLLHYKGWLFEDPKRPRIWTKLWFFIIKYCYVRASKPLLWSYQDGLPHLPVPSLKQTCERLLISMEPFLSKEEFTALEEKCKLFQAKEGRKLQWYLILKSWVTKNYVSDWWLRFVYLRGRSSLLVHSNYYGCGDIWTASPISNNREGRAASLIYQYITCKQEIDHEMLQPIRLNDTIPMCMNQYQYMYSTTRIPGLDTDYLQQYESQDSRHIAVLHQGVWYRVNVFTPDRKRLSAYDIQVLLRSIVENSQKPDTPAEGKLGALTTESRPKWAELREVHFYRGLNKSSLAIIERAMFVVVLDDESPSNMSEHGRLLLTGDGTNRWCDKSFCLVIFKNGRCGFHTEHSWGDAPVVAHVTEISLAREVEAMKNGTLKFDADGHILPPEFRGRKASTQRLIAAQRLSWQIGPDLEQAIEQALVQTKVNIDDVDLECTTFEKINRGVMKKCKCPPDAFVQMGIQLAFYRLEHRFVPTYEPAMMRLFRNGRTETIRSCSKHSCAWVNAMEDPSVPREKKQELLRIATQDHQLRTKESMAGMGIDRHLFALYVVSRGMDVNSPFLEQMLSYPWTLSTSQVPWRQANQKDIPGIDWSKVMIASGGFGPVDSKGYGCCYNFMDDKYLLMHISSRKSAPNTDSKKMLESLTQAFEDMVALFV